MENIKKLPMEKYKPKQSQKNIAKSIGISPSFMCDILHERKLPSAKNALMLEDATGIPFKAWLIPSQYYNGFIHQIIGDNYSFIGGQLKTKEKKGGIDLADKSTTL